MAEYRCGCGAVVQTSGPIPHPDAFLLLSEERWDERADAGDFDLSGESIAAQICPACGRFWIWWDGFGTGPTIYSPEHGPARPAWLDRRRSGTTYFVQLASWSDRTPNPQPLPSALFNWRVVAETRDEDEAERIAQLAASEADEPQVARISSSADLTREELTALRKELAECSR